MRRAGPCVWVGALVAVLGCSGAPSPAASDRDFVEVEPMPAGPETRADDPLLARARGQMRRGRVPDDVREQLLASRDPDHRRAGRLLQAVAGETPAAVLSRSDRARVDSPKQIDPDPPSEAPPRPDPSEPTAKLAEPKLAEAPDLSDDARLDPLPKLDDVPLGSPLRSWLDESVLELQPEPLPVPIDLPLERLNGTESVLLRERPPRPPSDADLVILTSIGSRREPDVVWLELAGSGRVGVWMQPLDEYRVRLTIADAGAVPSFVAARLESSAFSVLDVARRERDVELELAVAPGWVLSSVEQLDNGAKVAFSRSDTLPP